MEESVHKWCYYVGGRPRGLTKEDRRYPGYEFKDYDLNQEEFPLTDNVSNTENMFEKNG